MSNTYFQINTNHVNFPNASQHVDLTAFIDNTGGGVQITLGREYAILDRTQALLLAQAIVARYTSISATDDSTFPHILNVVHQERGNADEAA